MPADPEGGELPLPALLSHLLVAFTVEFDNEFEHRMPHRTTRHGSTAGAARAPWLVSMAMWVHCMRHVPEQGLPVADLVRRSKLQPKSAGMIIKRMGEWWGYLTVDTAAKTVRPTRAGRQAQAAWEPLPTEIEARWRQRFGAAAVAGLTDALSAVEAQFHVELPDFMPVGAPRVTPRGRGEAPRAEDRSVTALLSRVLLALALDFEDASDLSLGIYTEGAGSRLPICATVLRVLSQDGVRAAGVPASCGVAKMTVDNWMKILEKRRYLETGPDPGGGRFRVARLTSKGTSAQAVYPDWAQAAELRWAGQYGTEAMASLRAAAEAMAAEPAAAQALRRGMEPYPDGWRAQVPVPLALPHFPVISARGGFPDGH